MKKTLPSFYDAFSSHYAQYSEQRHEYLAGVEDIITSQSKKPVNLYLDVGAGTGERTLRLAEKNKAKKIIALDESSQMLQLFPKSSNLVLICGTPQDFLKKSTDKYDLITCLWNVLGHVASTQERIQFLLAVADLLTPDGEFFIDVNNRYNGSSYGNKIVLKNIWKDVFARNKDNGTYPLSIKIDAEEFSTKVHLFSPQEMSFLFRSSGLKVKERYSVDYSTGRRKKSVFSGQLLYRLEKQ